MNTYLLEREVGMKHTELLKERINKIKNVVDDCFSIKKEIIGYTEFLLNR